MNNDMNREQIDQAARKYSDESLARTNAYTDRTYERRRTLSMYDASQIEQAFADGAEWRINSVWHPNTENPNAEIDKYGYGKDCLVQVKYKTLIELVEVLFENDTYVFLGERETYTMNEVVRWAYVSDLMPYGKENKV